MHIDCSLASGVDYSSFLHEVLNFFNHVCLVAFVRRKIGSVCLFLGETYETEIFVEDISVKLSHVLKYWAIMQW